MNITECREELEQCYRGSHSRVTEARLPDISPTFTTQEFHDLGEVLKFSTPQFSYLCSVDNKSISQVGHED